MFNGEDDRVIGSTIIHALDQSQAVLKFDLIIVRMRVERQGKDAIADEFPMDVDDSRVPYVGDIFLECPTEDEDSRAFDRASRSNKILDRLSGD